MLEVKFGDEVLWGSFRCKPAFYCLLVPRKWWWFLPYDKENSEGTDNLEWNQIIVSFKIDSDAQAKIEL